MSSPPLPSAPAPERRYAGASAQERRAARRERLVASAIDVFGRRGYRETTLRMICSEARLTDRYFYEHFASVDEVFLEVHQRLSADAARHVLASVAPAAGDDSQAMVRAGLTGFFEFIKADPRRAQVLLIDAVTAGLASPLNINARISRYVDVLRQRFKQRYPRLQMELDLELVVGGFVGMIIHTASVWFQRGFDTPVDRLVDHTAYAWAGLHDWLARNNVGPA